MKKILAITVKELTLTLRDRTALLLMLVAPLALTLVMNFAFGRVSSGGLSQINVVIVNHDDGTLGQTFVDFMQSSALSDLVHASVAESDEAARKAVDESEAAAAVIVPAGLSERVTAGTGNAALIEVYGDPGRPISAGVVRTIVERFAEQVAAGTLGAQVTVTQLVQSGRVALADAATAGADIGNRVAVDSVNRQLVTVKAVVSGVETKQNTFNYLQYYAPGMAIMFLMFAMVSSARTLLAERELGTLARLRSTPTQAWEVLGGKVLGVLATGVLQMAVLILITTYAMGVQWGDALGVAALVTLTVAALGAMGLLVVAFSRTANQAGAIGSAIAMVLSAVGGNFIPRLAFPEWLRTLSLIGPNAWSIEGFQKLAAGATLFDLRFELLALAAMTAVFFGVATLGFRRIVR